KGGCLLNKPMQALKGRVVRCILFDLGGTLWTHADPSIWEQLETSANLRAVALLRKHVASQLPANLDDLALGQRLRHSFSHYVGLHAIAVAGDLSVTQPHPVILFHTLNTICVAPEYAVMVGDSLSADISGAQRLGILTTWKPQTKSRAYIHTRLLTGKTSTSE